jgi:transcriptional regulator with XRE-family HTH domain
MAMTKKSKSVKIITDELQESEAQNLKKIGERLKHFRKKAGFTNYEYFAYEHGFSRPQYGKYEAGANIQLNTLMKILKALNVSLEEFFKGFR